MSDHTPHNPWDRRLWGVLFHTGSVYEPLLLGATWGDDLDSLAQADGFADREEMAGWFGLAYGLPFRGYLHEWTRA